VAIAEGFTRGRRTTPAERRAAAAIAGRREDKGVAARPTPRALIVVHCMLLHRRRSRMGTAVGTQSLSNND